jgi:hypothetical protein
MSAALFSTEEVMGLCPTQGDENSFYPATTVPQSTALPFVISTGAPKERSEEICGPAVLFLEMFSTEPGGQVDGMIRLFFEGRR